MYFNRERVGNELFATIDTRESQTVLSILAQLVSYQELEPNLQRFITNINSVMAADGIIDDYSAIAMEEPELADQTMYKVFVQVGESATKKNIVLALSKVLGIDSVLYHTDTWAEDRHSVYSIPKQQ